MKIGEDERPFLIAEARAYAEHLSDPDTRTAFEQIALTAEQGEVPDELIPHVAGLLALALESGRTRTVHGPAGVRALLALWKETPRAREMSRSVEDLNVALGALKDLPVRSLRVSPLGPGSYSVSVAAGDLEVRLSVDRSGVTLRSVNVGGGGVGE